MWVQLVERKVVGRQTNITKDWKPKRETVQELRRDYPQVDSKESCKRFVLYMLGRGNTSADWDAAFTLWVMGDAKRQEDAKSERRGYTDDMGLPLVNNKAWRDHLS